jgi:site-specific DNA-methyltransferase (adenine-specific)
MDLMSMAIRLAGFELRDSIGYAHDGGGAPLMAWCYGSGFPKSHDVSKAIDKAGGLSPVYQGELLKVKRIAAGLTHEQVAAAIGCAPMTVRNWEDGRQRAAGREVEVITPSEQFREKLANLLGYSSDERRVVGLGSGSKSLYETGHRGIAYDTAPATEAARQWQGWGTALKPAWEPIILARKPLIGTVAENVLKHGTGAINVDGCRVGIDPIADASQLRTMQRSARASDDGWGMSTVKGDAPQVVREDGRWPANLILSDDPEVVGVFPNAPGQQGPISSTAPSAKTSNVYGAMKREGEASQDSNNTGAVGFKMKPGARRLDQGSAARFFKQVSPDAEDIATAQRLFYCAKASKRDRDEGLEGFESKQGDFTTCGLNDPKLREARGRDAAETTRANVHPTVKPTDLMAYLCRLVTPPGGVVLDPFMGSGSTGKAAIREGFQFIGCEMSPEYMDIARARIQHEVDKIEAARVVPEPVVTPQPDLFA